MCVEGGGGDRYDAWCAYLALLLEPLFLLLLLLNPLRFRSGVPLRLRRRQLHMLLHQRDLEPLDLVLHYGHGEEVGHDGLVAAALGEPQTVDAGAALALDPGDLAGETLGLLVGTDETFLHESNEQFRVPVHGTAVDTVDASYLVGGFGVGGLGSKLVEGRDDLILVIALVVRVPLPSAAVEYFGEKLLGGGLGGGKGVYGTGVAAVGAGFDYDGLELDPFGLLFLGHGGTGETSEARVRGG